MKIALVISGNLSVAPYVKYYTSVLEILGLSYDIISWDRLGLCENNTLFFPFVSDPGKSMYKKIADYYNYSQFVKGILRDRDYDKVVVFTIPLGLLLSSYLIKNYRFKYILDIRDYSFLMKIFHFRFLSFIKYAYFTVISSYGFLEWLPTKRKYVVSHNCWIDNDDTLTTVMKRRVDLSPSCILTIGALRDYIANRFVINELVNSGEFVLRFVGSGPAELKLREYVNKMNIRNVVFEGRYQKEDELVYAKDASFINVVTSHDRNSKTLMSNRFYLAVKLRIPVIVNANTRQAFYVKKYNLGVVIDEKYSLLEQLLSYQRSFNQETFEKGCLDYLSIVKNEQKIFCENIKSFFCS